MNDFISTVLSNLRKHQPTAAPCPLNVDAEDYLEAARCNAQKAFVRFQVQFYRTMRYFQGKHSPDSLH